MTPASILVVDGAIVVVAYDSARSQPTWRLRPHWWWTHQPCSDPGYAHNTGRHSGLLRGTAESLALFDWLETYVDPTHRA